MIPILISLNLEIRGDDIHVLNASAGFVLVIFCGFEGFVVQGCAGGGGDGC